MDRRGTWEELAQLNHERMLALGIPIERHTSEVCLMQLMAGIGELSSLAFRTPVHSEFEQEEIEDVLGGIALALATVAEANNVDIADAAMRKAHSHIHRANARHHSGGSASPVASVSPKRTAHYRPHSNGATDASATNSNGPNTSGSSAERHSDMPARPPPIEIDPEGDRRFVGNGTHTGSSVPWSAPVRSANGSAPAASNATVTDLLLSPRTASNFFPMLEILGRGTPSAADLEGLRFCVPVMNRMIDLIPNGSQIAVTPETWPQFCELARKRAPPSHFDNDAPPMRPSPSAATIAPAQVPPVKPVATQHIEVHAPSGYDAEKVEKLFSPAHFEMGLFSPHTKNTKFDIPVYASGAPGGAVVLPAALQASPRGSEQSSPSQPISAGAPASAAASSPSAAAAPPVSLMSPPQGADLLQQQQQQQQQQPQRSSMEAEFWARVQAIQLKRVSQPQIAQLGLTFTVPHNGRLVELIPNGEQIAVTATNVDGFLDLVRDKVNELEGRLHRSLSIKTLAISNLSKYNPKAEAGLYSPTHFALDLFAPHTTKTTFNVDYEGESSLPPSLRSRQTVTTLPTAMHFVEYISNGQQHFEDIFSQVKRDPEALHRFQVTYCAVDPANGVVVDLVPGGRSQLVSPAEWKRYVELVDELYIQHN